jgi:hypothetical protein
MKEIVFWCGKPITKLSRKELIDALAFSAKEIERLYADMKRQRDFMFDTFVYRQPFGQIGPPSCKRRNDE